MIQIGEILQNAKTRLKPISNSASLDAQLLLAEILSCNRAHIIAHPEKSLTPEQAAQYEAWISRREHGEPIAYILGRQAFYDREFIVTSDVLIPRPETELLLEMAVEIAQQHPDGVVVDVGTGSGALAVTFAAHAPEMTVYAIDLSENALAVAKQNAAKHQTSIQFMQGDLLQPLIDNNLRVNLVMANLPYIATGELQTLEVSKHEPSMALDGGADGLDFIRQLLDQVPLTCEPGASILLEIGADQGVATVQLAQDSHPSATVSLHQDLAGLDRLVRIDL